MRIVIAALENKVRNEEGEKELFEVKKHEPKLSDSRVCLYQGQQPKVTTVSLCLSVGSVEINTRSNYIGS